MESDAMDLELIKELEKEMYNFIYEDMKKLKKNTKAYRQATFQNKYIDEMLRRINDMNLSEEIYNNATEETKKVNNYNEEVTVRCYVENFVYKRIYKEEGLMQNETGDKLIIHEDLGEFAKSEDYIVKEPK